MQYFVAYDTYESGIAQSKGCAIVNLEKDKIDMDVLTYVINLIRKTQGDEPVGCDIITAFNRI